MMHRKENLNLNTSLPDILKQKNEQSLQNRAYATGPYARNMTRLNDDYNKLVNNRMFTPSTFIKSSFQQIAKRAPSVFEFNDYFARLSKGEISKQYILEDIAKKRSGVDNDGITAIFKHYLGREPRRLERKRYNKMLSQGMLLTRLGEKIAGSNETAIRGAINKGFRHYLSRAPTPAEYQNLMNSGLDGKPLNSIDASIRALVPDTGKQRGIKARAIEGYWSSPGGEMLAIKSMRNELINKPNLGVTRMW